MRNGDAQLPVAGKEPKLNDTPTEATRFQRRKSHFNLCDVGTVLGFWIKPDSKAFALVFCVFFVSLC